MLKKRLIQQEINQKLKHPIQKGDEFNTLIDKLQREVLKLGDGDTHYTVQVIKKFINKYHIQVVRLAKQLQGNTLGETVRNVHQFMRKHIQYEIDEQLQRMRSPSNIWQNRTLGTDCKGFTIFSGAVLKSLGISFRITEINPTWPNYPQKH
jgi:hypothetical protein